MGFNSGLKGLIVTEFSQLWLHWSKWWASGCVAALAARQEDDSVLKCHSLKTYFY